MMLDRVLGSNHQKRLRQWVRMSIDGYLMLVHSFEQCRLCLRSSTVDFISQQHVGKNRPVFEFECLFCSGVNRNPQNIRGKHVAGELHALKTAIEGPRQRMPERS